MQKGQDTKQRLIDAAMALIEAQGYAATGLNQILADSGAPRGSLYFHFPAGKEELTAHMIASFAKGWTAVLQEVSRVSPNALAAASMVLDILIERFERTSCSGGCPVTSVTLEMANRSQQLRAAARAAYDSWADVVREKLVHEGFPADDAARRARVAIAAIEGALIVGRAYAGAQPLRDLQAMLPVLLRRD